MVFAFDINKIEEKNHSKDEKKKTLPSWSILSGSGQDEDEGLQVRRREKERNYGESAEEVKKKCLGFKGAPNSVLKEVLSSLAPYVDAKIRSVYNEMWERMNSFLQTSTMKSLLIFLSLVALAW